MRPFALCLLAAAAVMAASPRDDEAAKFAKLYADAKAEGGQLSLFLGGDEKYQRDSYIALFKARYPAINVTWKVDVSKYHDSVIDRNLNMTGKAGVDVTAIQTLHDFDRWKNEGRLLQYRPIGSEHIPAHAKDIDGYWTGINYRFFTTWYNPSFFTSGLKSLSPPSEFSEYLSRSNLGGKIVLTYPNDDDAICYQFYMLIQQYGWAKVLPFLTRPDIRWIRGTASPSTLMTEGKYAVSFTTSGLPGLVRNIPKEMNTVMWPNTAAIFKTAEHPAAAKLYLSWTLTEESQNAIGVWPIREDQPVPEGLKPLDQYPNLDPTSFRPFMRDRALVERYKLQFEQILGTAQGPSPLDDDI